MKPKTLLLMTALSALGTVAACSSPYEVTTRDGESIVTSDKPEVDSDDDFVEYEKDGNTVRMNKSEVREIKQVD